MLPRQIVEKIERAREAQRGELVGMVYDLVYERLPTLADVYAAKHALEGKLARTPLVHSLSLSREMGFEAHLKLESLQPIGAFKVRGGVNLVSALTAEEKERGIIGASTGNHGQSLAYWRTGRGWRGRGASSRCRRGLTR
jgi:threonine synthase